MKLKRLLFTLIAVLNITTLLAQDGPLLSKTYKPSFRTGTVKSFFNDIEAKTDVSVSYSHNALDDDRNVTMQGSEQTIKEVLSVLLADQKVVVLERKNKLLLIPEEKTRRINREQQVTINGYIKEAGSKEVLIGAVVFVPGTQAGTTTNNYGYYSLTLPAGSHKLVSAYIGYKTDTQTVSLKDDLRRDVMLEPQNKLEEIKVTKEEKHNSPDHIQVSYTDIKERPALLGETDVMRTLQNYAGVTSGTDGTSVVLVRGGEPGQNLNLLDGTPLYYVDHFFGLTSVFNSEAVKSVDFHKGSFPSRYGGRVSSVIDVNTRDGDMEHWGGQFSVGLVKGTFNLEGPLVKDKASIMVSARRTWIDGFWRFFTDDLKLDFYDVNAKANYIVDKNNRLYLSFYNGRDQYKISIDSGDLSTRWGNTVAMARWTNIVSPKLFVNTYLTYSQFRFELNDTREIITEGTIRDLGTYSGKSSINDATLKFAANWYPSSSHRVEAGVSYSNAGFTPVSLETKLSKGGVGMAPYSYQFQSNEIVLYGEDEIKLGRKWILRPGLHFANWIGNTFNYSSLQPRVYLSYNIARRHMVYASFTQMAQFLHLINNNSYGLPTNFWIPSTDDIAPEESYMSTVGYSARPVKGMNYSIEFYYKDIENVTSYNMGKTIFDNSVDWADNIVQGRGTSYGAEFSFRQALGKFRFMSAYTLSWSWRQFDALNSGKRFPYKYDRRHNIKAGLVFKGSEEFDMAANWMYMSGEAITLPDQIYPDFDNNLMIEPNNYIYSTNYTYNYVEWNNYRLPAVHRLDLVFNFTHVKSKRMARTWSFGVFNAYAQKNVMFVQLMNNTNGTFSLKGIAPLRFIPYVCYQLKF
jgi:hypothetical protein